MPLFKTKNTTKNLFFGNPEAESESNHKAKIKLEDIFVDYLNVLNELETEKFIVTGRKGSGKSAIGQKILKQAKQSPNIFCEYIRKSDIDLEEIVQFSKEINNPIQKEQLFKWIILTRIIKLITQNQSVQKLAEIKTLRHFLEKNRGFIDIDKYEIKEIIKTSGFEILIEKLMHFFQLKKTRETRLTGTKAPFYKLIPHLEEVIVTVLKSNEDLFQCNDYRIIFDDLDIEFKAENKESIETLLNLIRITKQYNNVLFSDNEIDAKVIILLRDDISEILIKQSADMSKIFSSYNISLTWFDFDLHKRDENLTQLKQLIDNRIKIALKNENIECNINPWDFFIEPSSYYHESSFKYVVDHTFQTPRDLILFLQDSPSYRFQLPMNSSDVNTLIGAYALKVKGEINNALAIYFSSDEIDNIFLLLKSLRNKSEFSFDDFKRVYVNYSFRLSVEKCCEILFDYSLIGNKSSNSATVYFRHRDNSSSYRTVDVDKFFVIHRILKIYLSTNK